MTWKIKLLQVNDALQSLIILTQTVATSPTESTQCEVPVAIKAEGPDFEEESSVVSPVPSVTYDTLEDLSKLSGSNNKPDDKSSSQQSTNSFQEFSNSIASSEKDPFNSVAKTQSLSKSDQIAGSGDCADNFASKKLPSEFSSDQSFRKFSGSPSYVAVGKLNGTRLCFNGNRQRTPVVKTSVKTSKIFKDLEEQLKNTRTELLKHSFTKTTDSFISLPATKKRNSNTAASVISRSFDLRPNTTASKAVISVETKPLTSVASTLSHGGVSSSQIALKISDAVFSDKNPICLEKSEELNKVTKVKLEVDSSLSAVSSEWSGRSDNILTCLHPTSTPNHPPTLQRTCFALQDPLPTIGSGYPNSSSFEGFSHAPSVDWRMNMPYSNSRSSDNQSWRYSHSSHQEHRDWRQQAPRHYFRNYGKAQPVRYSQAVGTPRYQARHQASYYNEHGQSSRVMYILRGAPGSGKSTKAKHLCGTTGKILSTDDYFNTNRGYMFDPTMLPDAHEWNRRQAEYFLKQKTSPVIIDNTNLESWEMKPYMMLAMDYGYEIVITEPDTWWRYKAHELAKTNTHGVPKERIESMLARFERNVTIERVLGPELFRQYQIKCLNRLPMQNEPKNKSKEHYTNASAAVQSKPVSAPPGFHSELDGHFKPVVKAKLSFSEAISGDSSRSACSSQEKKTPGKKFVNNKQNRNSKPSTSSMTSDSSSKMSQSPTVNQSKSGPNPVEVLRASNKQVKDGLSQPPPAQEKMKVENFEKKPGLQSRIKGGLPRKTTNTNSKKSMQRDGNLLKSLDHSEKNWSSFISDVESKTTPPGITSLQDEQEIKLSTFSVSTMTEEADFLLLCKINNGMLENQDMKVLSSNSAVFKPASSKNPIKIMKITFEKSTTTEGFEQNTNENSDLDTLRLLFSDYSSEDLRAIYVQCDRQLQWTTDVIAESSLFGLTDCDLSRFQKDSNPPLSLDDYYNTLCETQASSSDETENNNSLPGSEDLFQLKLPAEFLLNLAARFGEVENTPEDCVIDIDLATARSIYDSWKKTFKKKTKSDKQEPGSKSKQNLNYFKNSYPPPQLCELFAHSKTPEEIAQLKKDEAFARKLQEEEHSSLFPQSSSFQNGQGQTQSKASNVKFGISADSNNASSNRWSVSQTKTLETLTQIIDEEKAAEKAEQRQANKFTNLKLATQLKREELHEMYRSLPRHLLDEIFTPTVARIETAIDTCFAHKAGLISIAPSILTTDVRPPTYQSAEFSSQENNFNLENTMFAVNYIFDEEADLFYKSSSLLSSPSRAALLSRKKTGESPKLFKKTLLKDVSGSSNSQRAPNNLEEADLTYDDIRREANVQRQQIHECQRKAAIANHQKKGALAFYYAKQANEHQKRLREANQRAATLTYNRMNEGRSPNELDLHGLHVDEAIDTLRSVINQRQDLRDSPRHLFVITGRGLNSAAGIPRVKNAVVEWLKSKNIRFELLNDGYFKISF